MKRKISLLLAILMILLAGCCSDGDSKQTTSGSDTEQTDIQTECGSDTGSEQATSEADTEQTVIQTEGSADADAKRAISGTDLKQAFINAGYEVEESPMSASDVEELGVHNVSSATALNIYKPMENGGVEKNCVAVLFQFDNEEDAVSAYNEIDSMSASEGMRFEEVKRSYGKKTTYEEIYNSDRGAAYFVTQVENTVVAAAEVWCVDGNSSYDNELGKVLESLGY